MVFNQNQPHFYRGRFSVAQCLTGQLVIVDIFIVDLVITLCFIEMITTGAIIHAKYDHLDFKLEENPVLTTARW